jgi:hypothetical protein
MNPLILVVLVAASFLRSDTPPSYWGVRQWLSRKPSGPLP